MGRVVSGKTKKIDVLEQKAEAIAEEWRECFEGLYQHEVSFMYSNGVLSEHAGHNTGAGLVSDTLDISHEVVTGKIPFDAPIPIEKSPEYQSAVYEIESRNEPESEALSEQEEQMMRERMKKMLNLRKSY